MNTITECHVDQANSTVDTDELLRNLGRFPGQVLPTGVLRELQSRGSAIHDQLVAVIRQTIDSAGKGIGSGPQNAFFVFGLFVPLATIEDLPLIESVLTVPENSTGDVFGDILHEVLPNLLASFFKKQSATELISWLDCVLDRLSPEDSVAFGLFKSLSTAAVSGYLDRGIAIDTLVDQLKKRSDRRQDLQSAIIVCELLDLRAKEMKAVDTLVRQSFASGQIDEYLIDEASWDDIEVSEDDLSYEESWTDPAEMLSTWCFEYLSDDLDPYNATYRFNEKGSRDRRILESNLPGLMKELQESTDEHFPRQAALEIDRSFSSAYQATIELINSELARFHRDSESWSGNGAYLGLALTVSDGMPLPTELIQAILRLSEQDRERLLGDQFGLVVHSLALTPLREYDFVEQWIWDANRSMADRREMVQYYAFACGYRNLDRQTTIEALVSGLKRALLEEPLLVAPYAESLALLTPTEHTQILEEAFRREDLNWSFPLDDLRSMMQDAQFAYDQYKEQRGQYRGIKNIVSAGTMFTGELFEEKTLKMNRLRQSYIPEPEPQQEIMLSRAATTTIRNEARAGRNDPCPCGSGKKYKKCCSK